MYVKVTTYDPDLFADNLLIFSTVQVTTRSQPNTGVSRSKLGISKLERNRVKSSQILLSNILYATSVMTVQKVGSDILLKQQDKVATQIPSKFEPREFASKLAAPVVVDTLVQKTFATSMTLGALFDNVVYRVQTGQLDLGNTQKLNKSITPVVGK